MPTCPSGHDSSADDYCDVCGLPMGDAPSASPAAAADGEGAGAAEGAGGDRDAATPPAPDQEAADDSDATCPNCSAANPVNALFCEACGYDFTTGQAPRTAEPSSLDLDAPPGPPDTGGPAAAPAPVDVPAADAPGAAGAGSIAPALTGWVAEVWIDPDWYADQDAEDPLPSAGVPTVVPLRTRSILVGRTSRSRTIHPDIDLSSDNGISRRHCQLTTDGSRWWVEDLGSSNGTYLGSPIGALPSQPVPPGDKREIAPDQRLYLGAWTRIVIRKAAPGED